MATVSVSYLLDFTPIRRTVYRVWHNGLIVGEYEDRGGAEALKDFINENPDIEIIYEPKQSSDK